MKKLIMLTTLLLLSETVVFPSTIQTSNKINSNENKNTTTEQNSKGLPLTNTTTNQQIDEIQNQIKELQAKIKENHSTAKINWVAMYWTIIITSFVPVIILTVTQQHQPST